MFLAYPLMHSLLLLGLYPQTPQKWHGILMLPPLSEPTPIKVPPLINRPASPPVDPPYDLSGWVGWMLLPKTWFSLSKLNPNWGILVLAIIIPPALSIKKDWIPCPFDLYLHLETHPNDWKVPGAMKVSFNVIGIPNNGLSLCLSMDGSLYNSKSRFLMICTTITLLYWVPLRRKCHKYKNFLIHQLSYFLHNKVKLILQCIFLFHNMNESTRLSRIQFDFIPLKVILDYPRYIIKLPASSN